MVLNTLKYFRENLIGILNSAPFCFFLTACTRNTINDISQPILTEQVVIFLLFLCCIWWFDGYDGFWFQIFSSFDTCHSLISFFAVFPLISPWGFIYVQKDLN